MERRWTLMTACTARASRSRTRTPTRPAGAESRSTDGPLSAGNVERDDARRHTGRGDVGEARRADLIREPPHVGERGDGAAEVFVGAAVAGYGPGNGRHDVLQVEVVEGSQPRPRLG